MQVVLELNVQHPGGLTGAVEQLHQEWKSVINTEPPALTVETYCRAELTLLSSVTISTRVQTSGLFTESGPTFRFSR